MSKGVLGSLQTKIAHTSTIPSLGNKDLRLLQECITVEKTLVTGLQRLANDFEKASDAFKAWGQGEGDDLGDVLSAAKEILSHASFSFARYAEHGASIRSILKTVRTREEQLDEARKRRRNVIGKAEAAQKRLSKMGQENKGLQAQTEMLMSLRNEIAHLDGWIFHEEALIMDFKRAAARDVLQFKFGGIFEMAEKLTIVGDIGKLVIDEISMDPTVPGQGRAPYTGYDRTRQNVQEATNCVNKVVFQFTPSVQGNIPSRPSEETGAPLTGPPGMQQDSFRDPSSPQSTTWQAQPQRPDLPYQLPSNAGVAPPGAPSSWAPPSQPIGGASAPGTPSSTTGPYGTNEFGQMASPPNNQPGTFPMASGSHAYNGAAPAAGTVPSGGRASMASIFGGIRRRAAGGSNLTPTGTPGRDQAVNVPPGSASPPIPGPNPWQDVRSQPPPQQFQSGPQPGQGGPQPSYGPPQSQYGPPQNQYGPPQNQYGPQQHQYGPQQYQTGPQQYQSSPQQYQSGPQPYQSGPQPYQSGPQPFQPPGPQPGRDDHTASPGPPGPVITGHQRRDGDFQTDAFWVRNNSGLPYMQDTPQQPENVHSPISTTAAAEGEPGASTVSHEDAPTIPDEPEEGIPPVAPGLATPRRGAEGAGGVDAEGGGYGSTPYEALAPPRPRLDVSPTPSNRSNASGTPEGVRTISAAAFRRPARTSGETPANEVAPLQVRKKAPPSSSPYATGGVLPDSAPMDGQTSSYEARPEAPPTEAGLEPPSATAESIADLPSPAYMVDLPTPVYESRPPLPNEEDNVHGRPLPNPPPSGYGQGQFSTSLE